MLARIHRAKKASNNGFGYEPNFYANLTKYYMWSLLVLEMLDYIFDTGLRIRCSLTGDRKDCNIFCLDYSLTDSKHSNRLVQIQGRR